MLYLYLTVSNSTVSGVLIREDEGEQKSVYYLSKSLLDAEIRYPKMEKLSLALMVTLRKFKHYFQSFSITVLTKYPLKSTIENPRASGQVLK